MNEPKTPQEGIVRAYDSKILSGHEMTKEEKKKYWACLNWVINNEQDKEILAWAYNTRGLIYANKHQGF